MEPVADGTRRSEASTANVSESEGLGFRDNWFPVGAIFEMVILSSSLGLLIAKMLKLHQTRTQILIGLCSLGLGVFGFQVASQLLES